MLKGLLKSNKSASPSHSSGSSAQDWLPFKDAAGHFIYRRDGHLVAVLQIEPINISLKSNNEKRRIISAVHEAWNGLQYPIQILVLPRPVDLDQYLAQLQEKARETVNIVRKRLLQDYVHYVTTVVRGGEALERRYYLLLSQAPGKQSKEELIQHAYELANNMSRDDLKLSICNDQQILDMLFSFLNPSQASFESAPLIHNITTIYKEGRAVNEEAGE